MAPSPEAARSASARRGSPRRAAGLALVIALALAGAGLIGFSLTRPDPVAPPQPDPAAAPTFLNPPSPATSGTSAEANSRATGSPADPTAEAGQAGGDHDEEETDEEETDGEASDGEASDGTNQDNDQEDTERDDRDSEATDRRPAPEPVGMRRSTPTKIKIPRINVDAPITSVGLDSKDQLVVPPLDKPQLTGWYKLGASPGEVGNAVIVGHVDSAVSGPAVFFHLGALKPGDKIEVLRKDGKKARFIVDGVARYPKNKFPTQLVYGPTNKAQLRLVTCGGVFDPAARSYQDNIVVFATLDEN